MRAILSLWVITLLVLIAACAPPETDLERRDADMLAPDAAVVDAALRTDAAVDDASMVDPGALDTGVMDAASLDQGVFDASIADAMVDAAPPDAGVDAPVVTFNGRAGDPCDPLARCQPELRCVTGLCMTAFELRSSWATYADGRVFAGITFTGYSLPSLMADAQRMEWVLRDDPRPDDPELRRGEATAEVPQRPDVVHIVVSDDVVAMIPVVDQPVRAEGDACVRMSGVDACALGTYCPAPAGCPFDSCTHTTSRCAPFRVDAVEIQGPNRPDWVNARVTADRLTPREPFRWQVAERWGFALDQDRLIEGQLDLRSIPSAPFDVYHGFDRAAVDVQAVPRPERAIDERCDVARHMDACVEGTACDPEGGQCRAISPPVLQSVDFVWHDTGVGARIRGRDDEGDLDRFEASAGLNGRRIVALVRRPLFFWDTAWIQWDGAQFEAHWSSAYWTIGDPVWPRARIRLIDLEGLSSEELEVEPIDALPDVVPGGLGEPCDYLAVLRPCGPGLICDIVDGADAQLPTCVTPVPRCPPGVAEALVLDVPQAVDGDPGRETPDTQLSCEDLNLIARPDAIRAFWTFTAPAAGEYRFSAGGRSWALLAVRDSCPHRHAELACGAERRSVDGIYLTEVDVDLADQQAVTIVVEYAAPTLVEVSPLD